MHTHNLSFKIVNVVLVALAIILTTQLVIDYICNRFKLYHSVLIYRHKGRTWVKKAQKRIQEMKMILVGYKILKMS